MIEIDPPNTTHEVDYIPAKTETVSWQQEKRSDKNATVRVALIIIRCFNDICKK